MKKIIVIFTAFILSFSCFAQSQNEQNSEITFSTDESKSEIEIPKILVHRNSFWNKGYEFSDGSKVSASDLNRLLKADADRIFVRKSKIWNGIAYAAAGGVIASYAVNTYANMNEFDDMAYNSLLSLCACMATGLIARVSADHYIELAVDSYNLKVLGLED